MDGAEVYQWERILGAQVHKVQTFHKHYLLKTGLGCWVAKKSRHPSHLQWWTWVDRELRSRGFDRMPRYLTDGREWLLTSWMKARPATYQSSEEIRKVAALLSRFHLAGRGLLTPPSSSSSHSLMERVASRYRSFSQLVSRAERVGGELGELLREYGTVYQSFGKAARERLERLPVNELTRWERVGGCVAHRDLASHNVLIEPGGKAWLIDFETAEYDAQIGDLWQLLSRGLSEQAWDPIVLRETLTVYEKNRPLVPVERSILAVLLGFPNEFFREALGLSLNKEGYSREKTLPYLEKIADTLPRWRSFLRDWAGW